LKKKAWAASLLLGKDNGITAAGGNVKTGNQEKVSCFLRLFSSSIF